LPVHTVATAVKASIAVEFLDAIQILIPNPPIIIIIITTTAIIIITIT
jgi:hypothetical protein